LALVLALQGGQHGDGEAICDQAANFSGKNASDLQVEALRAKAEILLARGQAEAAESCALKALASCERLAIPYQDGQCCLTLGRVYRELGFYWADQAIKYFERAIKRFEMLGAKHALADARMEYGLFFVAADENERAREQLSAAEPVFAEHQLAGPLARVRRELQELNR
jgi:tetratricopeptide (TPR) repeat protein